MAAAGLAALAFSAAAEASQETLSFTQQATGSVSSFLTLPTVSVGIVDSATDRVLGQNQLQIVVTLSNTGAYPTETLTQLVLNSSAFIGMATLPTVSVSQLLTTGPTFPTVTLSSTQSLSTGAVMAASADTGKGDFMLSLLNNGTSGVINAGPGHTTQAQLTLTFANGLAPSAASFGDLSQTTGGASYDGVAAFTNVNGASGMIGAMVAAPIPEPSSAMLALAALGFVAFTVRRRRGQ